MNLELIVIFSLKVSLFVGRKNVNRPFHLRPSLSLSLSVQYPFSRVTGFTSMQNKTVNSPMARPSLFVHILSLSLPLFIYSATANKFEITLQQQHYSLTLLSAAAAAAANV